MITDAIINLGLLFINGIGATLLNSSGFSDSITTAAVTLGSYFGLLSPLLPMTTLATCVSVVFAVEIAIFGWKTLKSLASHIPWIGGAGH